MSGVTEEPDSVELARRRAREAVRSAFEKGPEAPPERRCPTCGHVAATWRPRCPSCNKRYDRALPWLSDRMRWGIAAAVLVITGVIIWQSAPKVDQSKKTRAEQAQREQAKRIAAESERIRHEQRPVRGRITSVGAEDPKAPAAERLAARRRLYAAFEAAILAEARQRVATKEMKGPVREIRCSALIRREGALRDEEVLTRPRGRYDCVAVQRDVVRDGEVVAWFGNPFVGVLNFAKGTYVFCKDNKVPGEKGSALAKVTLDPACIGAEGQPRVRDGYLQPDDA
jgi:hypothetical protein